MTKLFYVPVVFVLTFAQFISYGNVVKLFYYLKYSSACTYVLKLSLFNSQKRMSVSKYVHVFTTWEVYPRVYHFQKRFRDVHNRFNNIINKGPYTSLMKHSLMFDKLKELRCKLENNLEVSVFGRDNIDEDSLVAITEPLQRSSQDITLVPREKHNEATTVDPLIRIAVAFAKINDFEEEGLKEVLDTVKHFISTLGKPIQDLTDSLLIVCHTDMLYRETDAERFRFCVIKKLHETFDIYLTAESLIFGIGGEMLSSKISLILETQIINGFFTIREYLQSFFRSKNTSGLEKMDIVESDQLMNAVQDFLKNYFGLLDILEASQTKGEPFVEIVLQHLMYSIRCAILDPLSSKFNLRQEMCNHIAHELRFEEKMKESVSKNTRYHLGKLQQPCEELAKAMTKHKRYRFPSRKFRFIAYPLRDDIRPTVLELEESLASFQRTVAVMKKLIFEINGNIHQSIVEKADLKKNMRNKASTDELRERILSIEGVYGTGTVYGEWEVHVETDDVKQHVLELIDQCNIRRPVNVRRVFNRPTVLAGGQVEHGWVLESQCQGEEVRFKAGTLGAFVDSDNGVLYALTCAHVVFNSDTGERLVYMKNGSNNREPFGTSHPNRIILTGTDPCPLIDIAAVKVLDEVCPYCTKYFKDEDGMMKSAELETETIDGQHIFKYGAASDLTGGIVCSDDYTLAVGAEDYLVLISPPAGSLENVKYALPGDSGSVNCIPDVEHNKTVKVVSMLSAGDMKLEGLDESICVSFLVGKGLEKLGNSSGGIELTLPSINNTSSYRSLFV